MSICSCKRFHLNENDSQLSIHEPENQLKFYEKIFINCKRLHVDLSTKKFKNTKL